MSKHHGIIWPVEELKQRGRVAVGMDIPAEAVLEIVWNTGTPREFQIRITWEGDDE